MTIYERLIKLSVAYVNRYGEDNMYKVIMQIAQDYLEKHPEDRKEYECTTK